MVAPYTGITRCLWHIAQNPGAAVAELSREWLTALDDYVQGFKQEALAGMTARAEVLQREVQDKARLTPGWDQLADNIEVWTQEGELVVGVMDSAFVSQAFALEYGDETTPPVPLLRTAGDALEAADTAYMDHMREAGA